jgi:phospholipase C
VHSANRRRFLQASASIAATSLLPESIQRALAVPASSPNGTLADVGHIVIFMQENRSFDHYFGTLRGVRGFGDRFPIPLPSGKPVWFQPRHADPTQTIAPFHLDTHATNAQWISGLEHTWEKSNAAIAGGRYDQWPRYKTDMTMGYYARADLPFHYALADAFTVCDHYFCSIPGATHPNRLYLMTGMVDPAGTGGGPALDNYDNIDIPKLPPYTWTTYPERLEQAGVSWQVYQQGLDFHDDYNGNFGTNVLADFRRFLDARPGSPLHRRGMSVRTLDDLADDVKRDILPQVSWLLPPAAFSEHPKWPPGYGATYLEKILDALTSNPDVWSRTALLVMYDENDGFFDHVVPPQPPSGPENGKSTVSIEGELHNRVDRAHVPLYRADNLPYGLGPRVPMIVVSPWTKGGYVCSQVFDHTSVLRFIEARFGVPEPNITTWRRAICGDLTSAFDFTVRDEAMPPLPDTRDFHSALEQQHMLPAPAVPVRSVSFAQEPGVRPARALPYALCVDGRCEAATRRFVIRFANTGTQGANFYVYATNRRDGPWRYTVEAGASLEDTWTVDETNGAYAFQVFGANGFVRYFTGTLVKDDVMPVVSARPDAGTGDLVLAIDNPGPATLEVRVRDNTYGAPPRTCQAMPGQHLDVRWPLAGSENWYDLTVTHSADRNASIRLAGHVETGRPSTTDPA